MTKVFNRARMSTATTGTGTVTLGSAITGFATFAEAGVSDADEVAYVIEEGNDFEIGIGTYSSTGPTLSRDTVRLSKIGGTAGTSKMSLGGTAEVFISPLAEELVGYGSGKTINQPLFDSYTDFSEISAPSNPSADTMRAYARDDGAGNTEMVLLDSAGNEHVISSRERAWTRSEVSLGGSATEELATGIPSDVTEIEVAIGGLTTGADNNELELQIGDSGGYETTGYQASSRIAGNRRILTDAFPITAGDGGFDSGEELVTHIFMRLIDATNNLWTLSAVVVNDNVNFGDVGVAAGQKALSAALDRVRINWNSAITSGTAMIRYR